MPPNTMTKKIIDRYINKKFATYTAFLVVFLTVLGFIPGIFDYREGKNILSEWIMILFAMGFIINNKFLKLFVLWAILRHVIGFFEISSVNSAAQIAYFKLSYVTLNTMIAYSLAYTAFVKYTNKNMIKIILDCICYVSLFQCFFMILQACGIWVFASPKDCQLLLTKHWHGMISLFPISLFNDELSDTITGLMCNRNVTASMLVISMAAFFRNGWKKFIPVIIVCLFLTKSMGGLVPMVIIMAFYLYNISRNKKIFLANMSIIIICFSIFIICNESFVSLFKMSGRVHVIKESMQIIKNRPVIGFGCGQFKIAYNAIVQNKEKKQIIPFMTAHNEYLQVLFEFGAVGFIIMIAFIVSILRILTDMKNEYKLLLTLSIVSIMLNSFVNFTFHTTVAVLCLIFIGLIEILSKKGDCHEICVSREN